MGATISLGSPSFLQWAHARSRRPSPFKQRLGEEPKGGEDDGIDGGDEGLEMEQRSSSSSLVGFWVAAQAMEDLGFERWRRK